MGKRHRTLSLSRFRLKPKSQPTSGRRQPSRRMLSLRATVTLIVCALGLVALVAIRVRRHDALVEWQRSLEFQGERVEWPPWNPGWPSLPTPRKSNRAFPTDLAGPASFAARNAAVMQYIPCYCGACPPDHHSNLNCYVTGFRPDGSPLWTSHASTCPICVNVTREVMLMTRRGWSLQQIRDTLDREYERAGYQPSTPTPHPPQSHSNHRVGSDNAAAQETANTMTTVRVGSSEPRVR